MLPLRVLSVLFRFVVSIILDLYDVLNERRKNYTLTVYIHTITIIVAERSMIFLIVGFPPAPLVAYRNCWKRNIQMDKVWPPLVDVWCIVTIRHAVPTPNDDTHNDRFACYHCICQNTIRCLRSHF